MRYRHVPYHIKRRIVFTIAAVILVVFYLFKNYSIPINAITAAVFIVFFYTMDHLFDIKFKPRHYFFALFFAVFGALLSYLYFTYPQYDKIQHIIIPMMFGSIVFHMMVPLNLARKWKLVFVFFVVVAAVGLHELGEYTLDQFTDFKLQGVYLRDETGLEKYEVLQEKIDDTMIDMSFGTLGAAIYVFSVAWFFKKRM